MTDKITEKRICRVCGEEKPLTTEFWYVYHGGNNFRRVCKKCLSAQNAAKQKARYPHKVCAKCGQNLTFSKFSKNLKSPDGLNDVCRECETAAGVRTCKVCGVQKRLTDYYAHPKHGDGKQYYDAICNECAAAARKAAWIKKQESSENKKKCSKCGYTYPLTKQWWLPDEKSDDGFSAVCTKCVNKEIRAKLKARGVKREQKPPKVHKKKCARCGKILVVNDTNFKRVSDQHGHRVFSVICRTCDDIRQAQKLRAIEFDIAALERIIHYKDIEHEPWDYTIRIEQPDGRMYQEFHQGITFFTRFNKNIECRMSDFDSVDITEYRAVYHLAERKHNYDYMFFGFFDEMDDDVLMLIHNQDYSSGNENADSSITWVPIREYTKSQSHALNVTDSIPRKIEGGVRYISKQHADRYVNALRDELPPKDEWIVTSSIPIPDRHAKQRCLLSLDVRLWRFKTRTYANRDDIARFLEEEGLA